LNIVSDTSTNFVSKVSQTWHGGVTATKVRWLFRLDIEYLLIIWFMSWAMALTPGAKPPLAMDQGGGLRKH
jgi:hypothetical protein